MESELKKIEIYASLKKIRTSIIFSFHAINAFEIFSAEDQSNHRVLIKFIYNNIDILGSIERLLDKETVVKLRSESISVQIPKESVSINTLEERIKRYDALWGILENRDKKIIDAIINRAIADPEFARALSAAFAKADSLPPVTLERLASNVKLPAFAPVLWQDRNRSVDRNPAQFIRKVYRPWLEAKVLTRQHVGHLDDALGKSYSQWIRPERHPEDAIDFAPGNRWGKIKDPQQAIDRRRESGRKAAARFRAKKAEKISHSPS